MSKKSEWLDRLREFWQAHRQEWGAKTRAVRLLFGDVPAAGSYWDRTMEVLELLEWEEIEKREDMQDGL